MKQSISSPATRPWNRNFILVALGQVISLFGNSILRFALPLYLLRQTGSAALFGLVTASALLPMIVLSLVGGILADRVNKRNIMVVLDFCTAALVLGFTLFYQSLPLVPLLVVTLMLLYSIQGVYQPTVQASIPALLKGSAVIAGTAIINQISALSSLLGPIIGGVLLGSFGLAPILLVSTVCFFLSAVMEIFIQMPHQPQPFSGSPFACAKADLEQSFSYLRFTKPALLHILGLALLVNLALSAALTVGLPVLITQTLGLSDAHMGFCEGAMGIGVLLGSVFIGLLGKRLSISKTALFLAVAAISLLPISLALLLKLSVTVVFATALICCIFAMAAATATGIRIISHVQMETPPELVGKVISCLMAGSMCAQPLGQVLYGFLFGALPAWLVWLGACVTSLLIGLYARKALRASALQG